VIKHEDRIGKDNGVKIGKGLA